MKKYSVLILLFTSILFAQNNIYFTTEPSLSPDSKTIIFAYENDLWTVPAEGGFALRLTGLEGRESNPVFSPDGKWLSSGSQDHRVHLWNVAADEETTGSREN